MRRRWRTICGTDHTELTVTSGQALDLIPRLPEIYDEPFADSSQIPTYLVSAMTRKHVTVALSGDGGDELFAGYNRYQLTQRFWQALSVDAAPDAQRRRRGADDGAAGSLDLACGGAAGAAASAANRRQAAQSGRSAQARQCRRAFTAGWSAIGSRPQSCWTRKSRQASSRIEKLPQEFPDLLARMQFLDLVTYLPDDILTKVDRASMAVALEARVPLLDHRVVEFSWRLPRNAKVRNHTTKWILRQVLYRHVPRDAHRTAEDGIWHSAWANGCAGRCAIGLRHCWTKSGCAMPHCWIPKVVRRFWQEHLDGSRNWQYLLWDVLMLEAWRERWALSLSSPT